MDRAHIRVTVGENKRVVFELMFEGKRVGELSAIEVLNLSMQSSSALRFVTGDKLAR